MCGEPLEVKHGCVKGMKF